MRNNFIFYISILLFCSCGNKSSVLLSTRDEAPFVISLDDAIEENEFSFEKFNGSFRSVQLETLSESLLTSIRFVGLMNDTIVVRDDADQIMSFTCDGKYIGRIGLKGGGPLEYNGITSLSLDEKLGHVIVVDFGQRVLRYNLTGRLITSGNLNNEVVRSRADNSQFSNNYIFNFYKASSRNPYVHSYYGINDSLKSEFINPTVMYKCSSSAWAEHSLTQLDDTIIFVKPLSDTVFQFVEGNITPRFVFRHKDPSLPQEKIDFFNSSEEQLNYDVYLREQQSNGYFVGIQDILETKKNLLFSLYYGIHYVFDKSNQSLYRITDFKDWESRGIFSICRNSDCNSLITIKSPTSVMSLQDILFKRMREKGGERLKNSPSEYEKLILDFEEENNPIVIMTTFGD